MSDGFEPTTYRTPITFRDLRRIREGRVDVRLVVRRRPPHLTVALVPRGRRYWPTTWATLPVRGYVEPEQ